jgi:hemerythrin-like domain-containing protein
MIAGSKSRKDENAAWSTDRSVYERTQGGEHIIMMPIAPLMIEHRLIERMIALMRKELERERREGTVDVEFVDGAVDFLKTYADMCHHGKEEDILFRDLLQKQLTEEHSKMIHELLQEHALGRQMVAGLVDAKEDYVGGNAGAITKVAQYIQKLVELYPAHIDKEDNRFFIPSMGYLSDRERADMIKEMADFDKQLIHEKYKATVKQLEEEKR